MKTSCIRHPENNRYIQLNEWQLKFCQRNHCAALLLSFFINWHEWKLKNDHYYLKANNIAELHGDNRAHNENAYLFFSMEELIEGTMNFYGKNAIYQALQLLVFLNVLTIHQNPNPRYHFDKTRYFQFYPAVCNAWIAENYPIDAPLIEKDTQLVDSYDLPKQDNRITKSGSRSAQIGKPSNEMGQAITNTTNNTTIKNQSIKNHSSCLQGENQLTSKPSVQAVIDALLQQGFHAKHFSYSDTVEKLQKLCDEGASVKVFLEAYEVAIQTTSGSFGVNYLAKVVSSLMERAKPNKPLSRNAQNSNDDEHNFQPDYSGSKNWMGDLI